jgi:outer membrane biosynthesis protein TonB
MNYPRFSVFALLTSFAFGSAAYAQPAPAAPAAPAAATIYDEKSVDKAPVLKRRLKPDFPSSLKKRDTPAEITLSYVVTAQGKVSDITVVKFNDADMVEPAYAELQGAEFQPAEKAGKPVSVRMATTMIFPEPKAPKPPKKKKD